MFKHRFLTQIVYKFLLESCGKETLTFNSRSTNSQWVLLYNEVLIRLIQGLKKNEIYFQTMYNVVPVCDFTN